MNFHPYGSRLPLPAYSNTIGQPNLGYYTDRGRLFDIALHRTVISICAPEAGLPFHSYSALEYAVTASSVAGYYHYYQCSIVHLKVKNYPANEWMRPDSMDACDLLNGCIAMAYMRHYPYYAPRPAVMVTYIPLDPDTGFPMGTMYAKVKVPEGYVRDFLKIMSRHYFLADRGGVWHGVDGDSVLFSTIADHYAHRMSQTQRLELADELPIYPLRFCYDSTSFFERCSLEKQRSFRFFEERCSLAKPDNFASESHPTPNGDAVTPT